jgi:hypothetical protein
MRWWKFTQGLHPIVAPLVLEERRANPGAFDRVTFPDLLKLKVTLVAARFSRNTR